MIMMTNLAIHTMVVPLQTAVPHLTKSKRKDKNTVIKEKDETIKERPDSLDIHKNRSYHQSKAPVERIKSTFSSAVTRKRKKIALFRDSILKNLRMG